MSPGPVNGAFASGLAGWTWAGRDAPVLVPAGGRTVARLAANLTLVSPPFVVPPGGQALAVLARAPRVGADAEIRARFEDTSAEVVLGTIAPGSALRNHPVGLAGLEGRTVRIVIDPVPALGRALDVGGVGPVARTVPGWRLVAGLPERAGPAPGRVLVARADRLVLESAPFAPSRRVRAVEVSLRGDGVLRASAGGRRVHVRATPRWRTARVPLPAGRGPVLLRLDADPRGGELRLRGLGTSSAPGGPR